MSEEAECPQKNKLVIDQSSFWDSVRTLEASRHTMYANSPCRGI